jgi:hypothetical protein
MPQLPPGFVPDGFEPDPPSSAGSFGSQPSVMEMGRDSARSGSAAPPGGIVRWFEENLRPMLEQVAQPKTVSDIAALLIPDFGLSGTVRAGARGIAATGRGVETAATSPVVTRMAEGAGALGAAGEVFHGSPTTAAAIGAGAIAAPRVAAATGRGLQRVGGALERAATDVPVVPAAAPVAVSVSTQKTLNEAALAARRAAYQASLKTAPAEAVAPAVDEFTAARMAKQAATEPIVAASGKMQLTGPEFKEFQRLLKRGLALPDALSAVKSSRELAEKLGGATDQELAKAVAHMKRTGKW